MYECYECEEGKVAQYDRCDVGDVEFCMFHNPDDPSTCELCHEGAILNKAGTKCIDCTVLGPGCLDCNYDKDEIPTTCKTCQAPSYWNN